MEVQRPFPVHCLWVAPEPSLEPGVWLAWRWAAAAVPSETLAATLQLGLALSELSSVAVQGRWTL